jgi:hypothetical protein
LPFLAKYGLPRNTRGKAKNTGSVAIVPHNPGRLQIAPLERGSTYRLLKSMPAITPPRLSAPDRAPDWPAAANSASFRYGAGAPPEAPGAGARRSDLARWRRLFDSWIHLFRMDDAVRLAQLFAQGLDRRSRLGARSVLTWSRVEKRRRSWRCGRLRAPGRPATRVTPATNRQSPDPMGRMPS